MTRLITRIAESTVGRNVFFLGISGAAKGLSSIALVLVAVRALDTNDAGEVILVFLAIRIAHNVAGTGLSRYLARETAHDSGPAADLTLDVIKLLAILLPLGLLLGLAAVPLDSEVGIAIVLAAIAAVAGSIQQSLGGTFLGRERTYLDSACEVVAAVVLVVGVVVAALLDQGAMAYIGVIAASRAVACGLALWLFVRVFRPLTPLLRASAGRAFTRGFPYMLNAGSAFVFLRADILLLGALAGTHAVSVYGGVADPLVTLSATVHIVNTAFLPALSGAGAQRPRLAGRMLALDLVLGCGLALIVLAGAAVFTERFLGADREGSVDVLRVLSAALALRFVSNGLATWITASGHQWRRTVIATGAGIFNIGANLITIPIWGYWAAVWTTLATEALILAFTFVALRGEWSVSALRGMPEPVGNPVTEGYGLGPE